VKVGTNATFTVVAGGTAPLGYQWRFNATNIPTATASSYTRLAVQTNDAGSYSVVISNVAGPVTSSNVSLTILTPPTNITMSVQQAANNDWDTAADWNNGYSASASVALFPTVTFELLPGARGRPSLASDPAIFPGSVLKLDGNGVWNDAFFTRNGNDGTVSEFRFKHSNPGTVRFPRLIMAGGMLDNGVYLPPAQYEAAFLSAAHTESDVEATIVAARVALESSQE
jgi:hypothetical protein